MDGATEEGPPWRQGYVLFDLYDACETEYVKVKVDPIEKTESGTGE